MIALWCDKSDVSCLEGEGGLMLMTLEIFLENKRSYTLNAPNLAVQYEFLSAHTHTHTHTPPSTPAACNHTHTQIQTHTHTSVHGHLFVGLQHSWVHMTASVKCGFGWQRKESLYLWKSKRLHAIAPRGENAKIACHSLVEMSFPYVWRTGSIFSCNKKKTVPLQFPWPMLYSFFLFSFLGCNNTLLQLNFLFFLEWGSLVVVGGLFLFPESTRHRSRAPYLISREENPSLQLLLIRVKWSRPTNSYRTLSLSLCLSVCLY